MNYSCKESHSLSVDEKQAFSAHLEAQGIAANVWDLFEQWVARSTPKVRFFYLKVYDETELVGVGLFLRLKPFDLRSSFIKLRTNFIYNQLARAFSALTRNCVYTTFQILITANLARPFFYRDESQHNDVMKAILGYLKQLPDADSVSFIDSSSNASIFEGEDFEKFPSPSISWIDVSRYSNIAEYLKDHKNLKRNLSRKKQSFVTAEVRRGDLTKSELEQLEDCVKCSIGKTKVYMPCQKFFEENVFTSKAYNSDEYIHVLIRIENKIAGFHTFLASGTHLGGVLGGFNRECTQKHFVYERVMVKVLEYAIENSYKRVDFSIIDNYTKLRLVTDREPCNLYFYSRNQENRKFFKKTFKHSDVNALHLLETSGSATSDD